MRKILEKLNKHFFPLVVVAVLLVGSCLPIRANAAYGEYFDYANMDYTVKYGTDYNTVTFNIDPEWYMFWWHSYSSGAEQKVIGTDTLEFNTIPGSSFDVLFYPASVRGFLLDNMPAGTRLFIEIELDQSKLLPSNSGFHSVYQKYTYMDSNLETLENSSKDVTLTAVNGNVYTYLLDYTIEDVDNAVSFKPYIFFENYTGISNGALGLKVLSAYVEMEVSKEFWSQFQAQQNGKMLNDMVHGTDEQHAIANESNEEMSAAAGKLDNLGDQLNSVDKPDANNMDVSADSLLGGMAATTMLTAPIREIWNSPVALSILTVVVTIVLISWVFFGKK